MLDFGAIIEPGRTAAGLLIGEAAARVLDEEAATHCRLDKNLDVYEFGCVRVWIENGSINQISVIAGYTGHIAGTAIGIGSSLRQLLDKFGPILEDDEDNLVAAQLPGLCFETEPWVGALGRESIEENLNARLTEICVFCPSHS